MISVNSLEKVDEKKNEFKEIGYEYLGEYGIKCVIDVTFVNFYLV